MEWHPPVAPSPPDRGSFEQSVNGYAIASPILGVLWLLGIGSILAVVFGFLARQRIAASDGRERGVGIATAGIVLGFIGIVLTAAGIVLVIVSMVRALNNFD